MAEENLEWLTSPAVVNQTVMAVKNFLDGELAKSESYRTLNESIKRLTDKHNYDVVRDKGVGQTTILKFLGGNWTGPHKPYSAP